MSKDKLSDYDGTTAGNNTDIGGISIAEGMLPSAVNNSMRELTRQLGAFANGTEAVAQINFGDNAQAVFGAGSDLRVYHDATGVDGVNGAGSYIEENGAGNLWIMGAQFVSIEKADGTNRVLQADTTNGDIELKYQDATRLATTASGIDVSGSITADDLKVDGTDDDVQFNDTSLTKANLVKYIGFHGSDGRAGYLGYSGASGAGSFQVYNQNNTAMTFHNNSSEVMRLTNGGNVGIGEDSPLGTVHIRTSDASLTSVNGNADDLILENNGNCGMSICSSTTGEGNINFIDSGDTNIGRIQYSHSDNKMDFRTNDFIRATIDSSGNLLVGKTNTSTAAQGVLINPDGRVDSISDGAEALRLNRKTSDGAIAEFRKDNTTVGSIGVDSGDNLTIGATATNHAGLYFSDSNGGAILPMRTNAVADGVVDLGGSNQRFENLYLSGGAYLGGTAAANKLDDYEEGTFGVSAAPQTSGTVTLNVSYDTLSYTKVGRVVTINGEVRISSVSSPSGTRLVLSNLPFAVVNLDDFSGRANGCTYGYISSTVVAQPFRCPEGNTQIWLDVDCSTLGSGNEFGFSFSYFTT